MAARTNENLSDRNPKSERSRAKGPPRQETMRQLSVGWMGLGVFIVSCATHRPFHRRPQAEAGEGGEQGQTGGTSSGGAGSGVGGSANPGGSAGTGGSSGNEATAGSSGGNDSGGRMNVSEAGQDGGNEECTAESDCSGSCQTCSAGVCVAVISADDPDSCSGTCDAKGKCKSKRGQTCAATANGCVAGSVCAPDGYCCDTACTESCQACDISGFEGTCTPVASGKPHGNRDLCTGEGTCGGSCTGRDDGKCSYPTSDCGSGPTCSGSDFVGQGKCSSGECVTPAAKSCDSGFACVGEMCKNSCSSDSDCSSGYFCQAGGCHLGAVSIAAGGDFSVAVLSDGSVYAWGYNFNGQIGPQGPDVNGTSGPIQNSAIRVTGLGSARTVTAGSVQACALIANGEVWCWGSNADGELGDGEVTTNYNPTPVKVMGLPSGVSALTSQQQTTCALIGSSNDVYCWGSNTLGELGSNASGNFSATPIKIAGLGRVSQVSMADHACGIVGPTLYCWGNNDNGECGQPSSTSSITAPVSMGFGLLGAPQQVGATAGHSCVLLTGGSVYCWGSNSWGCLGDPGTDVNASVSQPVQVTGLSGVTQLAVDSYENCAIVTTGNVWCWGSRMFGALGDGNIEPDGYSVTPIEVGNVSNAVALSMGAQHTCALIANGSIKCWGAGAVGQLGNSASSNSGVPVDVTATW